MSRTYKGQKRVPFTPFKPYMCQRTGWDYKCGTRFDQRPTNQELADALGVSRRTVTRWRSVGVNADTARLLCKHFDLNLFDTLGKTYFQELYGAEEVPPEERAICEDPILGDEYRATLL